MNNHRKCAVLGCPSRDKRMFTFPNPQTEKERFFKWLAASGNANLITVSHNKIINRTICVDHFQKRYILKKKLSRAAVPTLLLPEPLNIMSIMKEEQHNIIDRNNVQKNIDIDGKQQYETIFLKNEMIMDTINENPLEEHQYNIIDTKVMEQTTQFIIPKKILQEPKYHQDSDEEFDGDSDETCSEVDDNILSDDDDDQSDDFDAEEIMNVDDTIEPNSRSFTYHLDNDRNFELGKDNETIWTDKPIHSKFSKMPITNIVTHLPGPKDKARGLTDELQLFSLFITDEMIDKIVCYTNQEIEKVKLKYNSDQWYIYSTDAMEITAVIGILYMSAVLKSSGLHLDDVFSPIFGPSSFTRIMSKKRFDFLLRNMRFDDKNMRKIRRCNDKFAAFRDMWNIFGENCTKVYTPSEHVTVDKIFLSFRGKCPFKISNKYGLKIISLCDAKTFYFLGGIPYIAKENKKKQSDLSLPTQYVLRLTKFLYGSHRNITTDNWFSSYELTDELNKNKLTTVGTLRKNKPEIPPSMLAAGTKMSSRFLYQEDKMLISYTPERNKKMLLISSMNYASEINKRSKKLEAIEFYNITKKGVDILDKLCYDKTTKRKSKRWPMRFFYGILDIAAVNSFILYAMNFDMHSYSNNARSTFLKNLAYALTKPLIEKRINNDPFQKYLQSVLPEELGVEKEEKVLAKQLSRKRKRCDLCDRTKDRKGSELCLQCHRCLCGEHKRIICPLCFYDTNSIKTEM